MLTPFDIQEKEFSRSVRGYREEEVDEFLDQIIVQMENLIRENEALREKLSRNDNSAAMQADTESSVAGTLQSARALVQEISDGAEKKASMILENAELDAELIKHQAKEDAVKIEQESTMLKNNFESFKARYKNLLTSELERFESLTNEIYPELTIRDLEDLDLDSTLHRGTAKPQWGSNIQSEQKCGIAKADTVVFKNEE